MPKTEKQVNYKLLEGEKKRKNAWNEYEKGNYFQAQTLFTQNSLSYDHAHILFQIFNELKIEYFRAPYLAFAQVIILF